MEILTNLMAVIILQYIHESNHTKHLKFTQHYMQIIFTRKLKKEREALTPWQYAIQDGGRSGNAEYPDEKPRAKLV